MGREKLILAFYFLAQKTTVPLTACALYLTVATQMQSPQFWGLLIGALMAGLLVFGSGQVIERQVLISGMRLANSSPLTSAWLLFLVFGGEGGVLSRLRSSDILAKVATRSSDYGAVNELGRWRATLLSLVFIREGRKLLRADKPDLVLKSATEDALLALSRTSVLPQGVRSKAIKLLRALESG